MSKEQRKHERKSSRAYLRVRTSVSNVAYTVSLRNVSLGGAFIRTEHLPRTGETITFEILDEYGLTVVGGHGEVIRVVDVAHELGLGFAVQFKEELDLAMLDFLAALRKEVIT